MKPQKDKTQTIFIILILLFLILPFIQSKLNLITERPLKGYIQEAEKPALNVKSWFSGEYQQKQEKYLNENFGFRSTFIRINNELAFALFNKANARGVIVGKNNYLYEENYIRAYYGRDYIGKDSISKRMSNLKLLTDTLTKLNKTLILVFAAGKGSFYPEYFPDEYRTIRDTTNYEMHIRLAQAKHLNYIDFNSYFIRNKYTSEYPLYPQLGIHWSYYGQCLVADSILHYIEAVRNIDMADLYRDHVTLKNPQKGDADIATGMNLIFNPHTFKMGYPQVHFESDSGKTKPSVLVIADSFYWGIFNLGFSTPFSKSHFWFYNRQIFPDSYQSPLETSQVNLQEQIETHDIIIILATEATLPDFGWGFIENAARIFDHEIP
jgi:hypothetical protein